MGRDPSLPLPLSPMVCIFWVMRSVSAPTLAALAAASVPAWPPPTTMTSYRCLATPLAGRADGRDRKLCRSLRGSFHANMRERGLLGRD